MREVVSTRRPPAHPRRRLPRGLRLTVGTLSVSLRLAAAAPARVAPANVDETTTQRLRIDVRGAIAEVRVHRKLTTCDGVPWASIGSGAGTRSRSPGECILDLALPTGAALLRADLTATDSGRAKPAAVAAAAAAAAAAAEQRYVEAARAFGHQPVAVAFDDDVRYRLRIVDTRPPVGPAERERVAPPELDYAYAVPLSLEGNLAHLDFPAAPELSPPDTTVELRAELGVPVTRLSIAGETSSPTGGVAKRLSLAARQVSTRSAWRVTFTLLDPHSTRPDTSDLVVLASAAPNGTGLREERARLAVAVGRPAIEGNIAAVAEPERVLFVIDRSRSVGFGGLEAERDFALELLRHLPPSTRFDVVLFDRTPRRLFPVARQATRQALGALAETLVPDTLANGTELVPAIRFAAELLEREAADFAPHPLLVVLTDGAVGQPSSGRDPWTSATTTSATTTSATTTTTTALSAVVPLARLPDLLVAVVSIRPNDDPSTSLAERRRLQALAAEGSAGGIETALHVGDLSEGLTDLLGGLRAGGAVFDVDLVTGSGANAAAIPVAGQLVPGTGARLLAVAGPDGGAGGGVRLQFRRRGKRLSLRLHPTGVPAATLEALASATTRAEPRRFMTGPGFVALWEPVRARSERPGPPSTDGTSGFDAPPAAPRGFMERSVVRDALSLAYTPRARACYLTRSARTPEDRDLSGRVRMAIDLVRGEVGAARILSSTLARPTIEQCLRESAFALDVPRAYRNDDPVTAVLNLVFRPSTLDRRVHVDHSAFDRELELVIEAAGITAAPPDATDGGADGGADGDADGPWAP